ncbi:MAG: single-stranded DNA-binding protein [Tannerella sp.]|jgi:single-strand DNA-binding protein|nr:single-stranded DNA-binding protein [Tannerella sp.]
MSLNKVILIGNVGKDPDIRYFDNGNAIANFPMATSERGYKLANGTEIPERTEWHNIVATRDRAQFVEKYVKKGSSVYVEGKIRSRNYDDKDGIKRYITEIFADRIEFYSSGSPRREDNQAETATVSTLPAAPEVPPAPEQADDLPF